MDKADLWLRNGKLFNLLVLLCGLSDTAMTTAGNDGWAVFALVVLAGIAAPLLIIFQITRTIRTRQLIRTAVKWQ